MSAPYFSCPAVLMVNLAVWTTQSKVLLTVVNVNIFYLSAHLVLK
ncbi:hypothetical protein SP41_53 [Salmonella phage 41]|nr:hypothetical protein SP41_53 [Salmonella phage 41]